jgi:putative glutamine amidotransferase
MSRPLIAIPAYRLDRGRVTRWEQGALAVPEKYVDSVTRAGGRAVLLTSPDDGDPAEILEPFDGLMLIGGGDIDPFLYGTEPHEKIYGINRDRDLLEIALAKTAAAQDLPTLAICRGIQIANVAFGGTLHQHLPDLAIAGHGAPRTTADPYRPQRIEVEEGTRIAAALGAPSVSGRCAHHQAIDTIGDGLIPVARSDDGLVEGLERADGWFVAVQWHPEVTAATDPTQQGLFDALVAEATPSSTRR